MLCLIDLAPNRRYPSRIYATITLICITCKQPVSYVLIFSSAALKRHIYRKLTLFCCVRLSPLCVCSFTNSHESQSLELSWLHPGTEAIQQNIPACSTSHLDMRMVSPATYHVIHILDDLTRANAPVCFERYYVCSENGCVDKTKQRK